MTIRRVDMRSAVAQTLIAALNAELLAAYPEPGATHFRLEADEVAEGRGAFLLASEGVTPVGCGALRQLGPRTGEIKRMYVAPEARGRGVGRSILEALENEARAIGLSRLVLETGRRQAEAITLYEHAGFSRIPAFGEYVGSPVSVCMAKEL